MDGRPKSRCSHDFEADADEALAAARAMPAGPEKIEALKSAGKLRNAADTYGLVFAQNERSPGGGPDAEGR